MSKRKRIDHQEQMVRRSLVSVEYDSDSDNSDSADDGLVSQRYTEKRRKKKASLVKKRPATKKKKKNKRTAGPLPSTIPRGRSLSEATRLVQSAIVDRMFGVYDPWATLIGNGNKPCENRPESVVTTTPFGNGQWLGIHASKSKAEIGDEQLADRLCVPLEALNGKSKKMKKNRGKIIAIGKVFGTCCAIESKKQPEWREWVDSEKCQIIWDVIARLDTPIAVTGGQGTPLLTHATVQTKNVKGKPKTDKQIETATRIANERIAAGKAITKAIKDGKFTVTRRSPLSK
jgi:hypothetical protein